MANVLQENDSANSVPMREKIQRRAYDLFLARGAEHGHHLDDWFTAESEVAKDSKVDPDVVRPCETDADARNRTALQSSGNSNPDERKKSPGRRRKHALLEPVPNTLNDMALRKPIGGN